MIQGMIEIVTGFLGSLGFALLYNIRGKKLITAACGGFLAWALFLALGAFLESEVLRYFIVSLTVSAYAELFARLQKTPTTTFIITSLIPLIPGGSLYYTMAHAFSGHVGRFATSAIKTLTLAIALALGVVVTTAATRLLYRFGAIKHH